MIVQGYFLYPDGVVVWGYNLRRNGFFGKPASAAVRKLRLKLRARFARRLSW